MIPEDAILHFSKLANQHGAYVKLGEFLDPDDGKTTSMIYIYTDDAATLRRTLKEDIRQWWLDHPSTWDYRVSVLQKDWDIEEAGETRMRFAK